MIAQQRAKDMIGMMKKEDIQKHMSGMSCYLW